MSWLEFALNPFPDLFAAPPRGVSVKVKDALLKKRFTDRRSPWRTTTDPHDHDVMGGMLGLATYGGRVNTVAPDATASAQRSSIFDIACTTGWLDPATRKESGLGPRVLSRSVCGDRRRSGPGDAYDGALINHPDTTSRIRRGTHPAFRGTRCITRRTMRSCSGSRRGGTRGTCSGTRCQYAADTPQPWRWCTENRRSFRHDDERFPLSTM